jgi:hypothetical protein
MGVPGEPRVAEENRKRITTTRTIDQLFAFKIQH